MGLSALRSIDRIREQSDIYWQGFIIKCDLVYPQQPARVGSSRRRQGDKRRLVTCGCVCVSDNKGIGTTADTRLYVGDAVKSKAQL